MKSAVLILAGLITFASFVLSVALPPTACAQDQTNSLNDVYRDESHCLIGPEIRNEKDNPISCYCRDAIVDARYVWQTYLLPPTSGPLRGRDENLYGVELRLQVDAKQMCGEQYDVYKAVRTEDWKWNGPEVVRTYPPDDVLLKIKPDSHWMIHDEYTVVTLQRDSSGRVVKTESFTAQEMEPLDFLKRGRNLLPPKQRQ